VVPRPHRQPPALRGGCCAESSKRRQTWCGLRRSWRTTSLCKMPSPSIPFCLERRGVSVRISDFKRVSSEFQRREDMQGNHLITIQPTAQNQLVQTQPISRPRSSATARGEICKNRTANIGLCSFAIGPTIHRLRWSHSVIHWSMFTVLILQFFPARATSFFILFRSAIRVCNKHIAAFSFYQGTMYVYLFRGPSYREWQR